ncbi:MAG: GDYXXLXY domain-containing protein [Saprospiraceae bacterium]|nr:GDYXXLXY domain-containing protein [Saprospiraceae bacterium]
MKNIKWWIVLINLILLLVYFNGSIISKEDLLKNGKLVLLELAPVDPRSLMQGDYMSLRYKISEGLKPDSMAKQGYCVVKQDANGIAQKQHFQNEKSPLSADELLIKYHYADQWNIHIGAESYFFQEGQSEKYQKAKYGGIRVDKDGNSVLVGLYDEQRERIE